MRLAQFDGQRDKSNCMGLFESNTVRMLHYSYIDDIIMNFKVSV